MTTNIDEIKQGIAEGTGFIRDHTGDVKLLKEEQDRVGKAVEEVLEGQKQAKRDQLLTRRPNDRLRVVGGQYDGLDSLDLAIMRSLWHGLVKKPGEMGVKETEHIKERLVAIAGGVGAMDEANGGDGE